MSDRAVTALRAHGIRTLADLTVRIPRRRRWWSDIDGLGARSARCIEAFFAEHPRLTERARALVTSTAPDPVVPWEQIQLPHRVDGSQGAFRAPRRLCTLHANNDYEAIGAWLVLHRSTKTAHAYRKEAERLLLWSILERGKALSSLTTEDATAYRAFLRRPTTHHRWVAPARPRSLDRMGRRSECQETEHLTWTAGTGRDANDAARIPAVSKSAADSNARH